MHDTATTRRSLLRTGAATAAGVTLLASAGPATAQSEYGGYLDGVGNFDGTIADGTSADQVTIVVGAQGNGGPYAFDPPAVRVTPGTTIVWEWEEGLHNVVDEAGAFESEMTDETGFAFEHTAESPGVIQYFCSPHESMGMKGVVEVVEGDDGVPAGDGGGGPASDGGGASGDGSGASGDEAGSGDSQSTVGGDGVGPVVPSVLALAFVLPAAYAALRDRTGAPASGADGE